MELSLYSMSECNELGCLSSARNRISSLASKNKGVPREVIYFEIIKYNIPICILKCLLPIRQRIKKNTYIKYGIKLKYKGIIILGKRDFSQLYVNLRLCYFNKTKCTLVYRSKRRTNSDE